MSNSHQHLAGPPQVLNELTSFLQSPRLPVLQLAGGPGHSWEGREPHAKGWQGAPCSQGELPYASLWIHRPASVEGGG